MCRCTLAHFVLIYFIKVQDFNYELRKKSVLPNEPHSADKAD